ncbi:MAG: ArsR family transcriptional regulator [Candidatus Hodarchaeales archaeon]
MGSKFSMIKGLSTPVTFLVVTYLKDGPRSADEITDHLNLSKPEVTGHVDFLAHQGLIRAGPVAGKYVLSPLGELIARLYGPLDFIFKRIAFFKTHGIAELPWKLAREISSLDSSIYVDDPARLMAAVKETIASAVDELLVMTKKEFQLESTGLRTCDCILPPELITLGNQLRKKSERVSFRFVKETNFAMYIADKDRAVLFFPDNSGMTDYSCGFIINDNKGLRYVDLLWSYFWKLAGRMAF